MRYKRPRHVTFQYSSDFIYPTCQPIHPPPDHPIIHSINHSTTQIPNQPNVDPAINRLSWLSSKRNPCPASVSSCQYLESALRPCPDLRDYSKHRRSACAHGFLEELRSVNHRTKKARRRFKMVSSAASSMRRFYFQGQLRISSRARSRSRLSPRTIIIPCEQLE